MDYNDYLNKYQKISFYDQIRSNKLKSVVYLLILAGMLLLVIYLLAKFYLSSFLIGFVVVFGGIYVIIHALISYYFGHKFALFAVHAQPLGKNTLKEKHVHNIIEGLSLAAGIPKPKVYVMPYNDINAFAAGRDPEHAVVCISKGALDHLNDHELEGVLAHEISHIANYDIRFITLVSIFIGLIAIIFEFVFRFGIYNSDNKKNNLGIFVLIAVIIIYVSAILINFAISRKREFMADANAVKLTRDPSGLISALKKIKNMHSKVELPKTMSAFMFSWPSGLFSTHPPIEERIKILESLY